MRTATFLTVFVIVLITQSLTAQIPGYVPENGLVGWWPFTGDAKDESGNNHHGIVDGPVLTFDRFGQEENAYLFDGINDKVLIPHHSEFNFQPNNQFSLSYWMRADDISSTQSHVLLSKQQGSGNFQLGWNSHLKLVTAVFEFRVMNGPGSVPCVPTYNTVPELDQFYHVVNVFDNGYAKIYINGELVLDKPNCVAVAGDNLSNLHVGLATWEYPNTKGFTGTIDDIGVWNRPLIDEEVINLYLGLPNSTSEAWNESALSVYPNPTQSVVNVQYDDFERLGDYKVKVINTIGQEVFEQQINESNTIIKFPESLSRGMYFLCFTDLKGQVYGVRRIVLQ